MFITESLLTLIYQIRADVIGTVQSLSKLVPWHSFILPSMTACACMQKTEWTDRENKGKLNFHPLWGIRKEHCDTSGGTARMTVQKWEPAEDQKVSRKESVCDNLVEKTGLRAQHCLETENIFYREDLVGIIQVNWCDLCYLSCSACDDGPNSESLHLHCFQFMNFIPK